MLDFIKRYFRKLTIGEVAQHELAMSRLAKMQAETAKEYAESIIRYNEARIKRLIGYVNETTSNKSQD